MLVLQKLNRIFTTLALTATSLGAETVFQPTWESMQAYECPEWFRDSKFGIFLHYGVNSVPGYHGHYARHMYWQEKPESVKETGWNNDTSDVYRHHVETYGHPTEFGYKDFIPMWKAEKFDADKMAVFFKSIGAKYVVPMAVHHDNFDNWNSKHHRWNSVNMGPKKDLIGEWKKACQKHNLYFGVSSHFNGGVKGRRGHEDVFFQGNADTKGPLKNIAYDTQDPRYQDFYFKRTPNRRRILPEFGKNFLARHLDLIDSYEPDLLYFDGCLPYGEYGMQVGAHYLNKKKNGVLALKRGFPKGSATKDIEKGQADKLVDEPWQTDTSINPGWFYLGDHVKKSAVVDGEKSKRSKHQEIAGNGLRMDANQIVDNLIDIVSKNGNMLLNVGQRADGSIADIYTTELKKVGKWLNKNAEAIYHTRPWSSYGEGPTQIKTGFDSEPLDPWKAEDIRFTTKESNLYAITLGVPKEKSLTIQSLGTQAESLREIKSISLIGSPQPLTWVRNDQNLVIHFEETLEEDFAYVFKISH